MICILLGVPESERHWLFEAIEPQFDFGGSRKASLSQLSVESREAGSRMYAYGQELIASKRAEPTDDMLSVVANATVDDLEVERAGPFGSRAVPVLQSAVQCRCGDDPQRGRGWAAGVGRPSGAIACAACGSRHAADGGRGDGSVDVAVAVEAAHRYTRCHTRRTVDRGGTEGADLGGLGQPRRQRVRPRRRVRHRPKTQPALGLRPGRALLPGRKSGPAGTAGALRGTAVAFSAPCGWCSPSNGPAATGIPASGTSSWNCAEEQ